MVILEGLVCHPGRHELTSTVWIRLEPTMATIYRVKSYQNNLDKAVTQ